ncbi:hypothetical protein Tco_0534127 [Tanacetum coccineum]
MSRMDDDLFTYEVEIPGLASVPCNLNNEDDLKQQMTHGSDVDMEYDPSNTRGDDEVELIDKESSDSDDEDEVAEIFRIDTNVFDFETPTCKAFKEFNYLLQIDPDFVTKDIDGFKTYKEYKDDWIYEWNKDIQWRRWDGYENTIHDHEERKNEEEHENKERCKLFDNPHQETPVCKIRKFEMIKYSFGQDEEYVAIKECEYDDLTIINEDACRAYQEIFRSMDEGWMVTRAERRKLKKKSFYTAIPEIGFCMLFLYFAQDLAGKEIDKVVIMEYLVKISKKARILELKRRHLKITVLTSYTSVFIQQTDTAYSNSLNTAYRSSDTAAERITMTKVIKEEFKQLGLLKISDDLFTYDTQMGMIFNEFNRLSRINDDLFTYEIEVPKPTPCDEQ